MHIKKNDCFDLLVILEQLEALDLAQWLRSGAAAARCAHCDESSITRRIRASLKALRLELVRNSEFELQGDHTLLVLQRLVHQQARFLGHRPLRLDATHFVRRQLCAAPMPGWVLGPCDHRGNEAMLGLLQGRILDAWITSDLKGLPSSPALAVVPLWDWPGELVVSYCHPLANERGLSLGEVNKFPTLIVPDNLYPELANAIRAMGFTGTSSLNRYDVGTWDRITEDALTISYGSCISLAADSNLSPLDWKHDFIGGEALILLTEWLDNPAISLLLEDLRSRQKILQQKFPQLVGHL